MGQLFRPSINAIVRAGLAAAAAGSVLVSGVAYGVYRSAYTTDRHVPRTQEVPFSHKHHVGGLGLDCRYCHASVEESSFAGVPSTYVCMTCHSQVWTDAPMLAPVRESLAREQPLQWNRVHQLPDFVFFNHSIHVRKGVGCSACHGRIDQMPLTWKAETLEMRWCLDCHESPESQLRPRNQIFNPSWATPPGQSRSGSKLAEEYGINRQRMEQLRDCSMCHR